MTKPVVIRFKNSDFKELQKEAKSIPSSLPSHLKFWILNRNKILVDEYNSGYNDCLKDYHIKIK